MKKYFTLLASFIIMLCLGGIYAWSIFANELMVNYNWSSTQAQLVFGAMIAVFPTTMIYAGRWEKRVKPQSLAYLSALLIFSGYLLSSFAKGNFYLTLFSFGLLTGIGTGLGYLVALTTPVKWFPGKEGFVTGIASGGFGLAAVLLSFTTEELLLSGKSIMDIFRYLGVTYGSLICLFASLLVSPSEDKDVKHNQNLQTPLNTPKFKRLFTGIFLGTFAGLLVIGNLRNIGAEFKIIEHVLVLGISIFALTNFLGRLFWGTISDYTGGRKAIVIALFFQSLAIFTIVATSLTSWLYLLISGLIGFGFGGNFVLFAKEAAKEYGLAKLAYIYPYVFMGYAFAGILGPLTGGLIFDLFESYYWSIIIASVMSMSGALIFVKKTKEQKDRRWILT